MSSLRDDLNSRAYASADRYYRDRDLDDGTVDVGGRCSSCETDCLLIGEDGLCARCHKDQAEVEG